MRLPFPFDASSRLRYAELEPAASAPGESQAKLDVVQLLLGLIGFGVSLYALAQHLLVKQGAESLTCDVNAVLNCSSVLGSKYGEFLSIPLGAHGMAFFGIVTAAAIFPRLTVVTRSWMAKLRLLIASVGVAVSAALVYISYYKIGVACPVCVATHAVVILNFLWNIAALARGGSAFGGQQSPAAFSRFLAIAMAFAGPPLLVGVLAPSFVSYLPKPNAGAPASAPATPASANGGATAAKVELTVAKSAYVGAGEDYRQGNDSARVVLQMFSDFQCGYCAVAAGAIEKALTAVGRDRVLFVYRNYPLSNKCNASVSSAGHPYACELAHGARCAGQQGKFWEFKSWAFDAQMMSDSQRDVALSETGLEQAAGSLGLNVEQFRACSKAKAEMAKIEDDIKLGNALGITGTPSLFINGVRFEGNIDPASIQNALLAALGR